MAIKFVSEPIKPILDTCDTKSMSVGSPGLPKGFIWRDQKVTITEILYAWRSTGPCRHGSGEQYARKHWFEVKTSKHGTMKIYYNRSTIGRSK